MKNQLTYFDACKGKVIKSIENFEEDLFIFFEDDTFISFYIDDDRSWMIQATLPISEFIRKSVHGVYGSSDISIKIPNFVQSLILNNIIDEKSFMKRVELLKNNYVQRGLQQERATYERLKLKFEK